MVLLCSIELYTAMTGKALQHHLGEPFVINLLSRDPLKATSPRPPPSIVLVLAQLLDPLLLSKLLES